MGRHQHGWRRWLADVRRALTWPFNVFISAVDHERDATFLETCAEKGAIAVRQRMVEDGTRKSVMLHEEQSVPKRVRRRQLGAGVFEGQ